MNPPSHSQQGEGASLKLSTYGTASTFWMTHWNTWDPTGFQMRLTFQGEAGKGTGHRFCAHLVWGTEQAGWLTFVISFNPRLGTLEPKTNRKSILQGWLLIKP